MLKTQEKLKSARA